MDPDVQYLLSLEAVRERSQLVYKAAHEGNLTNFTYNESAMESVADYVAGIIKRDFGPDKYNTIPPHGRWQHFEVGGISRVSELLASWRGDKACDDVERCRRLIDLFFVSVLLDAGAGNVWTYVESGTGARHGRSEGLAVASLHMFKDGYFSSEENGNRQSVDGKGLIKLTTEKLAQGLQVSDKNPIPGVNSRAGILQGLGKSLLQKTDIFGNDGRPGNLVDYMILSAQSGKSLDVKKLWDVLQTLLIPIWPQDRTRVKGVAIGDAWPLSTLSSTSKTATSETQTIQPFHKLTQWLTYSLMVPFERILSYHWTNSHLLTGLPEYRNGGLFVDMHVLILRDEVLARGVKASGSSLPEFQAGDDVIVEWRAMTVVLLDQLYKMLGERFAKSVSLSMAQMLEAGSWKSGREIAAKLRPNTMSSPILIKSDGTVF